MLRWFAPSPAMYSGAPVAQRPKLLPKGLLAAFANSPDDEQTILTFTRQFGPLLGATDRQFSFLVTDWRRARDAFRDLWTARIGSRDRSTPMVDLDGIPVAPGERFRPYGPVLFYQTITLERLFQFELMLIPGERLRKCRNPECEHP